MRPLTTEADHHVECVTSRGSPHPLATPARPPDVDTDEPKDLL
jgi:hypothetical protein